MRNYIFDIYKVAKCELVWVLPEPTITDCNYGWFQIWHQAFVYWYTAAIRFGPIHFCSLSELHLESY